MKLRALAFIALLAVAAPSGAQAGMWSLGPNIGLSVLTSQNSSATVVAWPGDIFGFMPGLRVGYLRRGAPSEFFVDTGLSYQSSEGNSFRVLQATGNMQFNLARTASGPYLSAGLGFYSLSEGSGNVSTSTTVPIIGAGLGARQVLRHGHGAIRGEVRFDHFFEDADAGFEAFNALFIKVGFDLWMR